MTPHLTPTRTPLPARAPLTTLDEAAHLRALATELSSSQETDAAEAPPSDPGAGGRNERAMAHLERRVGRVEGGMSALLQSQARQLELASAQGASSRALAVLLRVGLILIAAIGAAAPLLSETLRSNPTALGPYGATIVAILVAVARIAQPRAEAPHPGGAQPPTGQA
jgi:hypothetical protein